MTHQHRLPRIPRHSGFSLIEILVGLLIGLLVTLVIMQVFSAFEGQKRATTGAADAQTNGSIALYNISHELQMAGFGLIPGTNPALSCTTINYDATVTDITPVQITDGINGSDSITITYGSSPFAGVQTQIADVAPLTGANDINIGNNLACAASDSAIISTGGTCDLTTVTAVAPDNMTLTLLNKPAGIANGSSVSCLGTWTQAFFTVLTTYSPIIPLGTNNPAPGVGVVTTLLRNGAPSVSDIVNIQARYGVSGACNSALITNWVDATFDATTGVNWAAPSVPDRNRIKAVRLAIVARDSQLQPNDVTMDCTTAKGTVNRGPCAWDDSTEATAAPAINLSPDTNYKRYRYRVYETIVPLRNAIWFSKLCN
jgi:type IV pilus assembly protein PilW